MVEAARARVRCVSPILMARGTSYHIKGTMHKTCVQSVMMSMQCK